MFQFLLVLHALIAIAMVGVILMQRSEGGGLAGGGSPAGLMSARGASNFLTRATAILAVLFVVVSIGMAALATYDRAPRTLDTSLQKPAAPVPGLPAAPAGTVPLATDAAPAPTQSQPTQSQPTAERSSPVPLAAPTRQAEPRRAPAVTRDRPAERAPTPAPAAAPRAVTVTPVAEKAAPAPAPATPEPAPSGTPPQ